MLSKPYKNSTWNVVMLAAKLDSKMDSQVDEYIEWIYAKV